MADYRLFFLGSDGAIEARQDFVAPDDRAALQVMAFIAKVSSDAHHGVMLWQGTRRIFDETADVASGGRDGADVASRFNARGLAAETQQCVLDCEDALLNSHWRLAKSEALLQATAHLRRAIAARQPSSGKS